MCKQNTVWIIVYYKTDCHKTNRKLSKQLEMAIDKTIIVSVNTHADAELGPESIDEVDSKPHTDKNVQQSLNMEMEMENDPKPKENEGLPIDRGWAWVVFAAATFYLMLFGGIRKNFGIFFVAFQTRFGSSASLTSLLNTIQNLLISFSSLIIMTIGMRYMTNRTSIMLGSLFLTTANIVTAYATDIRLLFVSVGFLEGIGTALVHPSVTATLGEYFHEKRGLANGLAFSGANFGGLIFAPIVSALFEELGYSGTLMIVAGMTLNILLTGALLRPIKSFVKQNSKNCESHNFKNIQDTKESEKLLSLKQIELAVKSSSTGNGLYKERNETDEILKQLVLEKESGHIPVCVIPNITVLQLKADAPSAIKVVRSCSYDADEHSPAEIIVVSPLLPRIRALSVGNRRPITTSHKGLSPLNSLVESLSRSRIALYSSMDGTCVSLNDVDKSDINKNDNMKPSFCTKLKASFDVSLFKNRVFPIFLFMAAMFAPANALLPVFLVPLATDVGLSAEETGLLMSIVGGVGMASRILCALFADRKFVKLTTILAAVSITIGIVAHCVRFFTSFSSLVFMAVMLGLCCEIYQAMYPVILVEYLTLPKLKSSIGFTVLSHGLAVAGTYPVVGTLRDATGNYHASFHFLGTMAIVGSLLALSMPYVHKRQTEKMKS